MTAPSNATYIKLQYHALQVLGDTTTSQPNPAFASLPTGTTFTITYPVSQIYDTTSAPPTTLYPQPIVCTFDSTGTLLDPFGNQGVTLISPLSTALTPNNYTLTGTLVIPGPPKTSTQFTIGFVKANTDGSYDITLNSPVPSSPGSNVTVGPPGPSGFPASVQTFTANGTYTVPSGTSFVEITCIGGGGAGGGGGSASSITDQAGGGGGAAGDATTTVVAVTAGAALTVTVGAGGGTGGQTVPPGGAAGGNAGSGLYAGGDSWVQSGTAYVAYARGGSGGAGSAANSAAAAAGGAGNVGGSGGASWAGAHSETTWSCVGGAGGGPATATAGGLGGGAFLAANIPAVSAPAGSGGSSTTAGAAGSAPVPAGLLGYGCGGGGGGGGAPGGAGGSGGAGGGGLVIIKVVG